MSSVVIGVTKVPSWILWAISSANILLVAVTALPFVPSNASWIRVWDFPRQQVAVLLVIVLAADLWLLDLRSLKGQAVIALSVIALACQGYRIWPYTPLHTVQAEKARSCPDESRVRLLVANVLVTNQNAQALAGQIREKQPDLVLLVEVGTWWASQMEPLHADYPYLVSHPRGDYGMYLLSRLELIDPQVRHLVDNEIPSIKTGVKLASGATFTLYGLHPPPPPRQDTAQRDAELLIVASEAKERREPVIVAGDLNDVAWSHTTHLFQAISGLLDPRIGRGFYSTFNANWPLLRWPLDHAFFDKSFQLVDLQLLDHIGSDHFPLLITLCHEPSAGGQQAAPEATPSDRRDAREAIKEGKEEAGKE